MPPLHTSYRYSLLRHSFLFSTFCCESSSSPVQLSLKYIFAEAYFVSLSQPNTLTFITSRSQERIEAKRPRLSIEAPTLSPLSLSPLYLLPEFYSQTLGEGFLCLQAPLLLSYSFLKLWQPGSCFCHLTVAAPTKMQWKWPSPRSHWILFRAQLSLPFSEI